MQTKTSTRASAGTAARAGLLLALMPGLFWSSLNPVSAQALKLPSDPVTTNTGVFTLPASAAKPTQNAQTTEFVQTELSPIQLQENREKSADPAANAAANNSASPTVTETPVEKMILKPGKSLSLTMAAEDIVCTNDVVLAAKQRENFPDSPEASFIYAVALSRTSRVEDALKEVRHARRLAEKQGGPGYFDKMIDIYEKMLTYYPEDNQVRYHLAWAYYMKAYVLAKYSHLANTPQAKYKEWVAQAIKEGEKPAEQAGDKASDKTADATAKTSDTTGTTTDKTASAGDKSAVTAQTTAEAKSAPAEQAKAAAPEQVENTDVLKNIHHASNTISSASPQAIPQVQRYYKLALNKLDDLLAREPGDVWARVYRAYLMAESTGDLTEAMSEWSKVRDQNPMNPAAYFFLGSGYLKQGNLKESLTNVSKAIALRAVGN